LSEQAPDASETTRSASTPAEFGFHMEAEPVIYSHRVLDEFRDAVPGEITPVPSDGDSLKLSGLRLTAGVEEAHAIAHQINQLVGDWPQPDWPQAHAVPDIHLVIAAELLEVVAARAMGSIRKLRVLSGEFAGELAADMEIPLAAVFAGEGPDSVTTGPRIQVRSARWMTFSDLLKTSANAERKLDWARAKAEGILDAVGRPASDDLNVSVYLADEGTRYAVVDAVRELLTQAGLTITSREREAFGSWFQRMRAGLVPVAEDAALTGVHMADQRLHLAQDARITAALAGGAAQVITALQPTKDAVVRLGAVLIVKQDWAVATIQLTAVQQAALDHNPSLAMSPETVIEALHLATAEQLTAGIVQVGGPPPDL
jgi:hypothetical protein